MLFALTGKYVNENFYPVLDYSNQAASQNSDDVNSNLLTSTVRDEIVQFPGK